MDHYSVLDLTVKAAKLWLENLDNRSVANTKSLEELRKALFLKLEEEGQRPEDVLQYLIQSMDGGLLGI
ncbi:hypothetical protein GZ77_19370 [Endozoicomonas montiporae]|uniref:Uncharacterized protein n=2 Tax=Endozoicomonas montiporae TaxID=1027273 RepID=A0A081N2I4_9GAMM|nr:hypothetical protein [Endozoicomonas montiporae]AMO54777.1 hypothetical protein EZMO1_0530 [Endozoicomonas montiporae CL-33]KEQ12657.1 hypothetical protein GZ77_19370 [Endozoicomonas montiporae]